MFDPGALHVGLALDRAVALVEGFPSRLPLAQRDFGGGQRRSGLYLHSQRLRQFWLGGGQRRRQRVPLRLILGALRVELCQRRLGLAPVLLAPPPLLALELQGIFQPADVGARLVITALRLVKNHVQLRAPHAPGFQPGFQPALFRQECLQRGLLLAQFAFALVEFSVQGSPAQGQQFHPQSALLGAQVAILFGGAGLAL